jgi:hypothetical protein
MIKSIYDKELNHRCPRCGKRLLDHFVLFIEGGAVGLGQDIGEGKARVCATALIYPISNSIQLSWLLDNIGTYQSANT